MPFPIAHSLTGATTCFLIKQDIDFKKIILYIFAANLPDIDYIPYFISPSDITYSYHHGVLHSFGFAVIASVILSLCVNMFLKWNFLKNLMIFFILVISHVLLDYVTYAPRNPVGVMLFYPVYSERITSSVHLFANSFKNTKGDSIFGFLSMALAKELLLELAVFVPILAGSIVFWYTRYFKGREKDR